MDAENPKSGLAELGPLGLNDLMSEIIPVARDAGKILLRYFDKLSPTQVVEKTSHRDLLSVADSEAEAFVTDAIRKRFPKHNILGEEQGLSRGSEPYAWVIDPLDGTTNYVRSFPFYAVSIGVLYKGYPIVGAVEAASLGESFVAARGQGAFLNERKLEVSQTQTIQRSILATGFSYNRNEVERNNVDNFSSIILKAHDIRRPGAASIDLAYVAAGRFDAYWEPYLKPWDVAAGVVLVEEAGGRVSGFSQEHAHREYLWRENIVASNGHVHDELCSQLSGTEPGYQPRFADFAEELG